MDFNNWNMFWSACFGVMAIMIVFGNCLSILVLLKRRLRKRPHFLLISLAMADLLVGLFSIPMYMIMWFTRQTLVSSLVFDCVDMFTGFSSVFTLVFISLERLNAIVQPLRHRQLALHCYFIAIATPWILSIAVTSSRVLLGLVIIDVHQFLSVIITSLSTPLVLMCIAYCVIWRKEASRLSHTFRARREARLSKTVLLITGMFILTWMPFQVLVIVIVKCTTCNNVSLVVVFVIKLLQFSNSVLNFFIYCFRMPNYRRALFSLLPSCNCCHLRNGVVHPFVEPQTTSVTFLSFSTSMSVRRSQQS
ncbi:histamine H2 receptor-like [Orbicella faveolata]|uniref:histamine H2 receptor-like n=1 Tax=Orbicella faveolata TaxID=48498 RepID=UPI0009E58DC0|nr:histamine H2 receptor-like [Orbicella faveolata]